MSGNGATQFTGTGIRSAQPSHSGWATTRVPVGGPLLSAAAATTIPAVSLARTPSVRPASRAA